MSSNLARAVAPEPSKEQLAQMREATSFLTGVLSKLGWSEEKTVPDFEIRFDENNADWGK